MTSAICNDTRFVSRMFNNETVVTLDVNEGTLKFVCRNNVTYTLTNETNPFSLQHGFRVVDFYIFNKYLVADISVSPSLQTADQMIKTYKIQMTSDNKITFHEMKSISFLARSARLAGMFKDALNGDYHFFTFEKNGENVNLVVQSVECPMTYNRCLKTFNNTTFDNVTSTLYSKKMLVYINTLDGYFVEVNDTLCINDLKCIKIKNPDLCRVLNNGDMYVWKCDVNTNDSSFKWVQRKEYTDNATYFFVNKGNKMYIITCHGVVEIVDIDRQVMRDIYTNKLYTLAKKSIDVVEFVKTNGTDDVITGRIIENIFTTFTFDSMNNLLNNASTENAICPKPPSVEPVDKKVNTFVSDFIVINDVVKNMIQNNEKYDVTLKHSDNAKSEHVKVHFKDVSIVSFDNADIATFIRTNGVDKKYIIEKTNGEVFIHEK